MEIQEVFLLSRQCFETHLVIIIECSMCTNLHRPCPAALLSNPIDREYRYSDYLRIFSTHGSRVRTFHKKIPPQMEQSAAMSR